MLHQCGWWGQGIQYVNELNNVPKSAYTIMKSLGCLKTFGTLVNFGQSSGMPDQFRISHLARGSFHLTRPVLFHFTADRSWLERASQDLFDEVDSGAVKIKIANKLPLFKAGEAHKNLEDRKTTGSTVLIS